MTLLNSIVQSLQVLLVEPFDENVTIPIDPNLSLLYRRLLNMAFTSPAFRPLICQFSNRMDQLAIMSIATIIYNTLWMRFTEHRSRSQRTAAQQQPNPIGLSITTGQKLIQTARSRRSVYDKALEFGDVGVESSRFTLNCGINLIVFNPQDVTAFEQSINTTSSQMASNTVSNWIHQELETLIGLPNSRKWVNYFHHEMKWILSSCSQYVRDVPHRDPGSEVFNPFNHHSTDRFFRHFEVVMRERLKEMSSLFVYRLFAAVILCLREKQKARDGTVGSLVNRATQPVQA
jgi:hypothetical protein